MPHSQSFAIELHHLSVAVKYKQCFHQNRKCKILYLQLLALAHSSNSRQLSSNRMFKVMPAKHAGTVYSQGRTIFSCLRTLGVILQILSAFLDFNLWHILEQRLLWYMPCCLQITGALLAAGNGYAEALQLGTVLSSLVSCRKRKWQRSAVLLFATWQFSYTFQIHR